MVRYPSLDIYVAEQCIGTFHRTGGDFPWMHGTFSPSPIFALFTSCVRPYAGTATHLDLTTLEGMGVRSSEVIIRDDPTDPSYLHALVFNADGTVGLRLGTEPLESDDGDVDS